MKSTNTKNSKRWKLLWKVYTKYFTTQEILLKVRKSICWIVGEEMVKRMWIIHIILLSTFWQLTGISIMKIFKSKQGLEPQSIILCPCELNLETDKYLYMNLKTSAMKQITMKLVKIQLCIDSKTGRMEMERRSCRY